MANIGWDRGQIYSTSVLPGEEHPNSHAEIIGHFQEFVQNFRIESSFVYREQLKDRLLQKQHFIEVDAAHLITFNRSLADDLFAKPSELLPLVKQKKRQEMQQRFGN